MEASHTEVKFSTACGITAAGQLQIERSHFFQLAMIIQFNFLWKEKGVNMAFDAFLKIDGIPGESTDDKHKDWIEVTSFSQAMEQPASATASSAGGATAERVNFGTFDINHLLDKASPKIYEACASGKHIKEVILELCRAGGDKTKYLEIKLEQVVISSVSSGGATGEGFPSEAISFSYGKIKWTYVQQKRTDGTGGGNVSAGWDLTANKVAA